MVMISCLPWSRKTICLWYVKTQQRDLKTLMLHLWDLQDVGTRLTKWPAGHPSNWIRSLFRWRGEMCHDILVLNCWTPEHFPETWLASRMPFSMDCPLQSSLPHVAKVTMVIWGDIWMWSPGPPGLSCCRRQPWIMRIATGRIFFLVLWGGHPCAVAILNVPWIPWSPIWIDVADLDRCNRRSLTYCHSDEWKWHLMKPLIFTCHVSEAHEDLLMRKTMKKWWKIKGM